MEKDIFGFADAIKLDHLTDEQILQLEKIFEDFAEYLFVYRKSDGDYLQTKVALQFISNAKNLEDYNKFISPRKK